MTKITSKILIGLLALTSLAFSQTLLTTTTLSSAMTSSQNTVVVASATGITISGPANQINTVLYVDHEMLSVVGLVSGTTTTFTVKRGPLTRQVAHKSGATVWIGAPLGNFRSNSPIEAEASGACTATAEVSLPLIYVKSAHFYDCLGGQWVLVSGADYPQLGAVVSSGTTIAATGTVFHVSGTSAIGTITLPNGFAPGMSIYVIPDGVFTWTAGGNIALAGTAVVNKVIIFTWSGSKWVPSYIA